MASRLSLVKVELGPQNMSTMETQTKHSRSSLQVTTHLQVRKPQSNLLSLLQLCIYQTFFMFVVDFGTQEFPLQLESPQLEEVKTQDPPVEKDLHLSLEDLFYGCIKKIKISRRVKADY